MYISYPSNSGAIAVVYASSGGFPASAGDGTLAIARDTDTLYFYDAVTAMAWVTLGTGGGGTLSIGTLNSQTASANGAVASSGILYLQSASTLNAGLVDTLTQSFAGNKSFSGTISASNLSGTNSGNVTIGTANGLSLATQALSLAAANTSTTGALTSTDWNTFNGKQASLTLGNLTETTSSVLTITGGTGAQVGSGTTIQVKQATASVSGFLAAADFTTFAAKQAAGNYITALTGDVTATGPGSVAGTVALVGGKTAAAVAQSVTDTAAATNLNTTSTIVKRDGSGNFSAGTITAALTGNATNVTGVVAAVNGGTGQSSYAVGDVLYASTTSALSKLSAGTNGNVLTLSSGIPAWTAPAAGATVLAPINANTTLVSGTTYLVDTSAGGVTLTLPAASAASGVSVVVQKVSTDFNVIAVNRAGSDTVFETGASVTGTTVNTAGEVITLTANGTATWYVLRRDIPSIPTGYTPSLGGTGTVTGAKFTYSRVGNCLQVQGSATTGTVPATAVTITIPSGITIDSGLVDITKGLVGSATIWRTSAANTLNFVQLAVINSNTSLINWVGLADGTNIQFSPLLGSTVFTNSAPFSVQLTVPISGWKG